MAVIDFKTRAAKLKQAASTTPMEAESAASDLVNTVIRRRDRRERRQTIRACRAEIAVDLRQRMAAAGPVVAAPPVSPPPAADILPESEGWICDDAVDEDEVTKFLNATDRDAARPRTLKRGA